MTVLVFAVELNMVRVATVDHFFGTGRHNIAPKLKMAAGGTGKRLEKLQNVDQVM